MTQLCKEWLAAMPKAELHLHLDGSLTASRLLALADKNSIELPYSSVEEVEAAYQFSNLQDFLDLYYLGTSVLVDEEDFYFLMMDYLRLCRIQNIIHCEIMVEPQSYTSNGVGFSTMMSGFSRAIDQAKREWGQSVLLILSFLRHLSQRSALDMLAEAVPFREHFVAIGLASSEIENPPSKFVELYTKARQQGYAAVAHAGEEGPPEYIWDCLNLLAVQRIDHGVRCTEDDSLLNHLRAQKIPLTVCPLSNVRLRVFDTMQDHNILSLLDHGLLVTVNSDDPSYFGGYLNENFNALAADLQLTRQQAIQLCENSFTASFLDQQQKQEKLALLEQYLIQTRDQT
jgi:adenosine deaminase